MDNFIELARIGVTGSIIMIRYYNIFYYVNLEVGFNSKNLLFVFSLVD